MAMAEIKMMLKESIGLHSRSIGDVSIERAIQQRMLAQEIKNDTDYWALLQQDANEFGELIEEVVVPETWFFRNTSPFDALVEYIPSLSPGKSLSGSTPLKVLSIPCSTGEEPYSIAMVLMERGLAGDDFSIDAFDISQRSLSRAKNAVYGQHSFREEYHDLRSKYFQETTSGYRLIDKVKNYVRFTHGNIIKDSFSHYYQQYDVIFCRNLLIYFDRATQSLVINKLHKLLKDGGIFCVGHAESSQVPKEHFKSLDIPMAFAFKKVVGSENIPVSDPLAPPVSSIKKGNKTLTNLKKSYQDLAGVVEKNKVIKNKLTRKHSEGWAKKRHYDAAEISPEHKSEMAVSDKRSGQSKAVDLKAISLLVEQGKLSDASAFAKVYLKDNPESSDAYYYLGLICHLEGGFSAAESLLKKSIYLDPHHHAAIGLLVLLAEGRGDMGQADAYRRRQQRAIHHRSQDD